ncbi:hypothetical protein [Streptomyces sp. WZ-12]|uniref:hypothetical protein n=1 Tax=Streptomyces sp. WZ-12 TaxID=3030210 RepID=UPI002380F826|nr:hypothetical protein [Streptomyces sp. WZ-12]
MTCVTQFHITHRHEKRKRLTVLVSSKGERRTLTERDLLDAFPTDDRWLVTTRPSAVRDD